MLCVWFFARLDSHWLFLRKTVLKNDYIYFSYLLLSLLLCRRVQWRFTNNLLQLRKRSPSLQMSSRTAQLRERPLLSPNPQRSKQSNLWAAWLDGWKCIRAVRSKCALQMTFYWMCDVISQSLYVIANQIARLTVVHNLPSCNILSILTRRRNDWSYLEKSINNL